MAGNSKPTPVEIRNLIENSSQPVIFRNVFDKWTWDLKELCERFPEKAPYRIGKKMYTKEPQWERSTRVESMSLSEFINKAEEATDCWYYFDYARIQKWFDETSDIAKKASSWHEFGYPDIGHDSVIWVGSKGAHTPCHYDTYGYNIIRQVYGKKKWTLFPPGTSNLQPTRVPYEESSVYSKLNFFCPDPNEFSGVRGARQVVLEAGDALFVPAKWWHYVENVNVVNISVNVWIPLPGDHEMRLREAIVQLLITSMVKEMNINDRSTILNINSDDLMETPLIDCFNQLHTCLDVLLDQTHIEKLTSNEMSNKHVLSTSSSNIGTQILSTHPNHVTIVPEMKNQEFQDFINENRNRFDVGSSSAQKTENNSLEFTIKFLDSLCHPDIIDSISSLLRK